MPFETHGESKIPTTSGFATRVGIFPSLSILLKGLGQFVELFQTLPSHQMSTYYLKESINILLGNKKMKYRLFYTSLTCSGVAKGAVRGTDCSLSTEPNKENPCCDPTL